MMEWNEELRQLRDLLAILYDNPADARRVAQDAGLKPSYIDVNSTSINIWHNILTEALNQDRVSELIAVARRQYPKRIAEWETKKQSEEDSRKDSTREEPESEETKKLDAQAEAWAGHVRWFFVFWYLLIALALAALTISYWNRAEPLIAGGAFLVGWWLLTFKIFTGKDPSWDGFYEWLVKQKRRQLEGGPVTSADLWVFGLNTAGLVIVLLLASYFIPPREDEGGAQATATVSGEAQPTASAPAETLSLPPEMLITPTLPSPPSALILAGSSCDELPFVSNDFGPPVQVQRVDVTRIDELVQDVNALVTVKAECMEAGEMAVAITFRHPAMPSIPFLQEPQSVRFVGNSAHVREVTKGVVLYALGQYDQSFMSLQQVMEVFNKQPMTLDRADIYWLWGNLQLRQEAWLDARQAYNHTLTILPRSQGEGSEEERAQAANLSANSALGALLANEAEDDDTCKREGRSDIENALRLAPNRADFHVILGHIILVCLPLGTEDNNIEPALEQAELALQILRDGNKDETRDKEYAPVYELLARIRVVDHLYFGDPLSTETYACKALKLDSSWAHAHHTLGRLYAIYGMPEEARQQFLLYYRSAPQAWQRADATVRWQTVAPEDGSPEEDFTFCDIP